MSIYVIHARVSFQRIKSNTQLEMTHVDSWIQTTKINNRSLKTMLISQMTGLETEGGFIRLMAAASANNRHQIHVNTNRLWEGLDIDRIFC